jgi:S-(hydroxymethyl)glutathione dehydrogenase/alcohol dehydrogenase
MRAAVVHQPGQEFFDIVEDAEAVSFGPGRVRIRMRAASLCHSDLTIMSGVSPHPVPVVPGHEGAGEVVEVGEGVTHVKPGDRVVVCWMPACGTCAACRRGQGQLCPSNYANLAVPNFRIGDGPATGVLGTGTFAEEIVVAASAAVPIPDDVPFELASLIGCGATTGIGAVLNSAGVAEGETVVVVGCGGVGISAVQGARVAGAKLILAVDPTPNRRQWALRYGASEAVAPEELSDAVKRLTGEGFDHAFEVVGRSQTLRAAFDATRRGGTVCLIGAGSRSDIPDLSMGELLSAGKTIMPSFYGGTDPVATFQRVIDLWRGGRVNLEDMITHRVPLAEANEAIRQMHSGEALRTLITIG